MQMMGVNYMKDRDIFKMTQNIRELCNIDLLKLFKDIGQKFKQAEETIKKKGY